MKKFNQIISLLSLGTLPIIIAGCDSKRATHCDCKMKAPKLIPSTPVPPKPKPVPPKPKPVPPKPKPKPKKDPFKEILLKHSELYNPFLLD